MAKHKEILRNKIVSTNKQINNRIHSCRSFIMSSTKVSKYLSLARFMADSFLSTRILSEISSEVPTLNSHQMKKRVRRDQLVRSTSLIFIHLQRFLNSSLADNCVVSRHFQKILSHLQAILATNMSKNVNPLANPRSESEGERMTMTRIVGLCKGNESAKQWPR